MIFASTFGRSKANVINVAFNKFCKFYETEEIPLYRIGPLTIELFIEWAKNTGTLNIIRYVHIEDTNGSGYKTSIIKGFEIVEDELLTRLLLEVEK